jgi:FAS-associated factor 2
MAEAELDIGQLSEEQQLALQQFTSVTDQEIKDAIPLLQRCQWNVQVFHLSSYKEVLN